MREWFNSICTQGKTTISLNQLYTSLLSVGIISSAEEVVRIIKTLQSHIPDVDVISYEIFVEVFRRAMDIKGATKIDETTNVYIYIIIYL